MTDLILWIVLLVLLGVDLLLTAARYSFIEVNRGGLLAHRDDLPEEQRPSVERALSLLRVEMKLRTSLNAARTLVLFLMAGATFALFPPQVDGWGVSLAALLVEVLLVAWVESLALQGPVRAPEIWAVRLALFSRGVLYLMFPVTVVAGFLAQTDSAPSETPGAEIEDELKSLVDAGQEEGLLEQGEREMLYSIFDLADTLVREIMVPRTDMLALDVVTPISEAVEALLASGHSRVPVYEETIDKVLGLLYAKDLLRLWEHDSQIQSLRDLLRPVYYVPEAKKADELLAEMQRKRVHMALVVDEYGGIAGMVTMEDVMEEILGDIRDEFDQSEELPYQEVSPGEYLFQGRIDLDYFNEIMGSQLPKEESDSLGGFIYDHLGRVPAIGETVEVDKTLMTVEQVRGRQIRKVRARRVPATPLTEKEEQGDADK